MIVVTEARGFRTGEERPGLPFGSPARLRRRHRRHHRRYWNSRRRVSAALLGGQALGRGPVMEHLLLGLGPEVEKPW